MEATFGRLAKVWWGFMWRGWVLMMPFAIILVVAVKFLLIIPKPGEPPQPLNPAQIPWFFAIWTVMMVGGLYLQIVALRWTLKTEWSDFKIILVPKSSSEAPPPMA